MTDLTLPGSIPGLLRRGSPVRRGPWAAVVTSPPAVAPDWWTVAAGETNDPGGPSWCEDRASAFALDLTDATGRAHAAWWVGEHTDAKDRSGDDRLPWNGALGIPLRAAGLVWAPDFTVDGWGLHTWNLNYHWTFGSKRGLIATVVPSLEGLSVRDPRLLPDGSRWVDAEALRRVVLHVAGVTP